MPHYRNRKSQAVHRANLKDSPKFLCGVTRTDRFIPTQSPISCRACRRALEPGTKHHITARDDPTYDLATEIGDGLPDGAFWALYNELGG